MTARGQIAHGGPQRLPARDAPSLAKALRVARGSPPWTPWTIRTGLTGPIVPMQPTLMSATQRAATVTPGVHRP